MLKNIFFKTGSVLVAFAILWIFAGSLVEFHQKYVFHKHTDFWQVLIIKSEKDQKKFFNVSEKNLQNKTGNDDLTSENKIVLKDVNLNLSEKSIYSRYIYDLLTSEYFYDESLRAPPLA